MPGKKRRQAGAQSLGGRYNLISIGPNRLSVPAAGQGPHSAAGPGAGQRSQTSAVPLPRASRVIDGEQQQPQGRTLGGGERLDADDLRRRRLDALQGRLLGAAPRHADPAAAVAPEAPAPPQAGAGGLPYAASAPAPAVAPTPDASGDTPMTDAAPQESMEDMRRRRLAALEARQSAARPAGLPTAASAPSAPAVPRPAAAQRPPASEAPRRSAGGYLLRYVFQVQRVGGDAGNLASDAPASLSTVFLGEDTENYKEVGTPEQWDAVDGPGELTVAAVTPLMRAALPPSDRLGAAARAAFGRLEGSRLAGDRFAQQALQKEIALLRQVLDEAAVEPFAAALDPKAAASVSGLQLRDTMLRAFFTDPVPCGDAQAAEAFLRRLALRLEHHGGADEGIGNCLRVLLTTSTGSLASLPVTLAHARRLVWSGPSGAPVGASALSRALRDDTSSSRMWQPGRVAANSQLRALLSVPQPQELAALLKETKDYPLADPGEVESAVRAPRRVLNAACLEVAALLKDALLKKDAASKQCVMDWLHAMLRKAQTRSEFARRNLGVQRAGAMPDGFALNLAAIATELALPVCRKDWGALVDAAGYCRAQQAFRAHDGWDRERSFGGVLCAPADAQEGGARTDFTFSTDVFFAAAQAVHLCVSPALRVFRWLYEGYARAAHAAGRQHDPRLEALALDLDSLKALLLGEEFAQRVTTVCATQLRVILRAAAQGDAAVAGLPVFLAADAMDWAAFLCHYVPGLAQSLSGMAELVQDAVTLCTASPLLQRHPLLEARAVTLIANVCLDRNQQTARLGDAWDARQWGAHQSAADLRAALYRDGSRTLAALPALLFRSYATVEGAEGFDIDRDDHLQHARSDALGLLVALIVQPPFRDALISGLSREEEDKGGTGSGGPFAHFLHALVTEGTHCLDDALNRLVEVKDLEKLRKDAKAWEALPERERRGKEAHLKQQEKSARGFMHSAVRALNVSQMLLNPTRADPPPTVLPAAIGTRAVLCSLAHLCRNFMAQLHGSRGEELRELPDAQRYDYDRLGLLQTLAQVVVLLGNSPEFQRVFALNDDYQRWVLSATRTELQRTGVGGPALLQRVSAFCDSCHELNPQEDAPPLVSDVPMWTPPEGKVLQFDDKVFAERMDEHRVTEVDLCGADNYGGHHFRDQIRGSGAGAAGVKQLAKAAKRDRKLLLDLPLFPQATIMACLDGTRMDVMRLIVSGREETPYAFGLFVFDVFLPPTYPHSPPLVWLRTTGGGTVRFNPNLYENGKVCLSLLGTWHGDGAETKWQPEVSSVYQVAMSIQSMILVPDPYFNEPGNEAHRGTAEGEKWNRDYNEGLRLGTLRHAVLDNLLHPPDGCGDAAREYYRLMAPAVLRQAHQWAAESSPARRGAFQRAAAQIQDALTSLVQGAGAAAGPDAAEALSTSACAKWADPPKPSAATAARGDKEARRRQRQQERDRKAEDEALQQALALSLQDYTQQQQQEQPQTGSMDADTLAALQAAGGEDAELQAAIAMSMMDSS
eukprot:TRINITY_DN894_c2_g1_i2.p1 TRINITY_DN894_c2_g1~~TRINITY_DN894_c2_g1_i2.p1  ORF type:complete len:1517 (+),score=521.67 TRINITY_DN894_c2_g1_i2:110-4660(+)